MRHRLARHLVGKGLDLGPGHMPFPLPEGSTVRYVDRLTVAAHEELFPELVGNKFPTIDVICDFDTEGLAPFRDASVDFVVCSHVLEHLADPIGMLDQIHRVLRPGGVLALVLPDRRASFDHARSGTTVAHLIAEHGAHVVDDAHIFDFLEHAAPFWADTPLAPLHKFPATPDHVRWHRARSVHAHCWTEPEFAPLIERGDWSIVEADSSEMEFGYALAKET